MRYSVSVSILMVILMFSSVAFAESIMPEGSYTSKGEQELEEKVNVLQRENQELRDMISGLQSEMGGSYTSLEGRVQAIEDMIESGELASDLGEGRDSYVYEHSESRSCDEFSLHFAEENCGYPSTSQVTSNACRSGYSADEVLSNETSGTSTCVQTTPSGCVNHVQTLTRTVEVVCLED